MPTVYWLVAGVLHPAPQSCLLHTWSQFRVYDLLNPVIDRHFVTPAGHSLGGGVAALVTLLLQQPGACQLPIGLLQASCSLCINAACCTLGSLMSLRSAVTCYCYCHFVTPAGHSLGGGVAALVMLLLLLLTHAN
jgi:hypothetical protein